MKKCYTVMIHAMDEFTEDEISVGYGLFSDYWIADKVRISLSEDKAKDLLAKEYGKEDIEDYENDIWTTVETIIFSEEE